jgi:molecular chaperone DnaK (HSP70)
MPAVRSLVQRITGHVPLTGVDPDEVVALGCAVQAAALVGHIDRGDAILLDESPDVDDFDAMLKKMEERLNRKQ